jgi:flagellar FliL protein
MLNAAETLMRRAMTSDSNGPDETVSTVSKKPFLIGLALAVLGGGSGFYAAQSGVLWVGGASKEEAEVAETMQDERGAAFAFVAIDPLIISLPGVNGRDHLRFAAQLEVAPSAVTAVEAIKPRIVDVLNGYLRAVDLAELEDPAALMRIRAQMLRRIHVVVGPDQVKDLLIMEFVLS